MARALELDVSSLKEFSKLFEKSPEITIRQTTIALKKSAFLLEAGSKKEAPVDTGRLRSSIVTTLKPFVGTITPTVKYAEAVHEGTKPRVIVPTKRRALRFKKGGRLIFTRKVNHPGTKKNPFMDRALRKGTAGVVKIFNRAIENIVNILADG